MLACLRMSQQVFIPCWSSVIDKNNPAIITLIFAHQNNLKTDNDKNRVHQQSFCWQVTVVDVNELPGLPEFTSNIWH